MKKQNNNVLVSIICLTYNHENYIKIALDSLIKQKTEFDYEIIVSDDASTDNTLNIVKKYQEKYPNIIKVISYKENVGASLNGFNAMKSAKGKYLASCEGDDFWIFEDKLQTQIEFLENNPNYVGCVHPIELVDENGSKIVNKKLFWVSNKKVFTIKDFNGVLLPGHICSYVRRNLFLDDKFDGSMIYKLNRNVADRTNFLLWLNYGNIYRMDSVMSAYRYNRKRNSNNLTSKEFTHNKSKTENDFNYLIKLEQNAKSELGIEINVEQQKINLYISAIRDRIKNKNNADKELPKIIYNSLKSESKSKLKVLIAIANKIFNKITYIG